MLLAATHHLVTFPEELGGIRLRGRKGGKGKDVGFGTAR